ncbi:MAM and LDL-receptor class A domain-containing protein 1-like [Saccostrea echinata]|uniref:MAM and LDL-receptor class A domain-containing protein 1-like n=1 Tax=Saccostrea echinata TaxID=191078 RepID=UPI002A82FF61|nr:MAM and LDL-receptor class A domain-containing protein 1-like [Saccostrea echinata]
MWSFGSTLFLVVIFVLDHTVSAVLPPSCTFDDGWCQWRPQNSAQGFQWHLGNGSTPDRSSGPVGDHTTKFRNGSYIFIKGIEAHRNKSIKAVVEANIDVTSDLQVSFWYFMNGVGIGILTLNKMEGDGSKTELWRKEGRQNRGWNQATISLPRGSFVLSFEASARLFYGSDLAVDDIEITPIQTTTNPPPSTLPPAMELPFHCDFDFESGRCDLKLIPSLGNTVGWNITSGSVLYKGRTLVSGDISGKGKYLILNNWNLGENGDAAQIISPVFENTGAACLSFYLYLATATSGTLSVYQKLLPSMELVLLHEASYIDPPGWKLLMFTLKGSPYFQIIMEGSYADSRYYGSVIGVDDVTIQNGECVLTTTPTAKTTSPKPSTTVSTTQVGISSTSKKTQSSSTLSSTSSNLDVSSQYSTRTSTMTTKLTTKGHTSSSYKPDTTINPSELSSLVTNSQRTTKSSSHQPWLSSIQTSKSSTLSSSVATTEKEAVFISSKSSSPSSLQTYIPSMTNSSLSSKQTTTLLTTKPTSNTSVTMTRISSRSPSVTSNMAKPTSQKSNSSTSSPPSTGSTSVILSTLITDVSTFTFQSSMSSITTGKSERSTLGKHTTQHTSSSTSDIPGMKTLTGSHTTSSTTSSLPASTNEAKLAGRETTAIVLGVCIHVPIIALVILSVIVLICKKDHSIHKSAQIKSKVGPYKVEKCANADTIELDDHVSIKGFRKLET